MTVAVLFKRILILNFGAQSLEAFKLCALWHTYEIGHNMINEH